MLHMNEASIPETDRKRRRWIVGSFILPLVLIAGALAVVESMAMSRWEEITDSLESHAEELFGSLGGGAMIIDSIGIVWERRYAFGASYLPVQGQDPDTVIVEVVQERRWFYTHERGVIRWGPNRALIDPAWIGDVRITFADLDIELEETN